MTAIVKPTAPISLGFIFLSCLITTGQQTNQDTKREAPFSNPPQLELRFEDQFDRDSTSDYLAAESAGDLVQWQPGSLRMLSGSSLHSTISAGSWVNIEMKINSRSLSTNDSPVKLRVELVGEDGETITSLAMDRDASQDKSRKQVSIYSGSEKSGDQVNAGLDSEFQSLTGQWNLSFRNGLWKVRSPGQATSLFGYLPHGMFSIDRIVLSVDGGPIEIESYTVRADQPVEANPTKEEVEDARLAEEFYEDVLQHYSRGELGQALALSQRVCEIQKRVLGSYHPKYALSLSSTGLLFKTMGRFDEAERMYSRAGEIYQQIVDDEHPSRATHLNNHAGLYLATGDFSKAESFYLLSNSIKGKVLGTDHPDYATGLNNLAEVYRSVGENAKAETLYVKCGELLKQTKGDESNEYAASLNNLATLYRSTGEYEKALPLLQQAMRIRKRVLPNQHPDFATSLHNLGSLYHFLGSLDKAEPLYLDAQQIRKGLFGTKHPHYVNSLNNLGGLYFQKGEYEKAKACYLESKDILYNVIGSRHPIYGTCLSNLAGLYETTGDYEKAGTYFKESLAIWEDVFGPEHPRYALCIHNIGGLNESSGEIEKAIANYQKAEDIWVRAKRHDDPNYVATLIRLAEIYRRQGDHETAEGYAVKSLDATRANLSRFASVQSVRDQMRSSAEFEYVLSRFISNSLQLPGRDELVFNQLVNWKGMNLIRQKNFVAMAKHAETKDRFAKLKLVKSQLAALTRSINPRELAKRKELVEQEQDLEQELANAAVKLGFVEHVMTARDLNLPAETALVEYRKFFYSKPESVPVKEGSAHYLALICTSSHGTRMLDLGPAKQIEKAIAQWRKPIEDANRNARSIDSVGQKMAQEAGRELRRLIWEPIEKQLHDSQLVIVAPDGALGTLPLPALPGRRPGTYLIEDTKVVYLSVPSVLPDLLDGSPSRLEDARTLLVGNIEYGKPEQKLQIDLSDSNQPDSRGQKNLGELRFGNLPGSKQELSSIRRNLSQATVLENTAASEDEFERRLPEHEVLHIATHGFFHSPRRVTRKGFLDSVRVTESPPLEFFVDDPHFYSGLAFANANQGSKRSVGEVGDDGILYSAEIALLPMEHVELAVLSACETSLGADDTPGEGLIGIQRAFQVAGARTTVASFWKVNDQATQMLMNKFYENLIEYGRKAKSEGHQDHSTTVRIDALRDAQLWMLRGLSQQQVAQLTRGPDDDTAVKDISKTQPTDPNAQPEYVSHPRYWAAFVLSGDWR